jgi:dipeptide/tripeptide permease
MGDVRTAAPGFLGKFTVLFGGVRELWIVFGAKLLTYFAYTVMNQTLTLWLSSDLGYNDVDAGYIVMGWSSLMTLIIVFAGSFTDAIGLRKTFLFGVCICILSRAVMTSSVVPALALGCGLLPLAVGEALMGPVMVAAVQRYTTTAQRSISFSIIYVMMNVGILLGNLVFDHVRQGLGEHGSLTLPLLHSSLSTYRILFLLSTFLSVPNLLLIYFCLRHGVEVTDEGVKITPAQPRVGRPGLARALGRSAHETARDTARIFAGLWKQTGFYKFLAFLSLAALLRLVVVHMYYTYPKFGIRELGAGAPVGRLWGINPFTIIILVPFVGALTQRIPAYTMVVGGSFIAASSVFIMAMPPAWFRPLADGALGNLIAHRWLGVTGPVNPYYVMIAIYVLWWTVGEAIYSPRLYEYAAAIAPKGQAASYMALSYLPFFLAKVFVGMSSGVLLNRYCPVTGPRHSQTMWLIIALITAVAPVGLVAFRRYIRVHEAGRSD